MMKQQNLAHKKEAAAIFRFPTAPPKLTVYGGRGFLSIRKAGSFRQSFSLVFCPILWNETGPNDAGAETRS